jgi:YggT family protein
MPELLGFIAGLISLYIFVVFAAVIMSWLIVFDVVNRRNRAVYVIGDTLNKLTDPVLRPIRRRLPNVGGLDLSPLVLLLGLIFVRDVVIRWLARTLA